MPSESPYTCVNIRSSANPYDILYAKASCFLEAADTSADRHASDALTEMHVSASLGQTVASK